ncbi:MAG: peptidylprolyl isomerase [Lachnospiraceae bacterium]|nr:peptidylprolyl isomerase [Lachnospiraceae bacterium]
MLKKLLSHSLVLMLIFTMVFAAGCGKKDNENNNNNLEPEITITLTGKHYVQVVMEDKKEFFLEIDADAAPITATHFIELVNNGYYNNLPFTYYMAGQYIQSGVNSSYRSWIDSISGEFAMNGYYNPLSHVRGTLSFMHTEDNYNDGKTEFIILTSDYTELDGLYAPFGKVIAGMSTVDEITAACVIDPTRSDGIGNLEVGTEPVISSMYVVDEEVAMNAVEAEKVIIEPSAELSFTKVDTFDDTKKTSGYLNVTGEKTFNYLLSSSENLKSIGVYENTWDGEIIDTNAPLAYLEDLGLGYIKVTLPVIDGKSNLVLVATETNYAVAYYMIQVKSDGTIRLIPIHK